MIMIKYTIKIWTWDSSIDSSAVFVHTVIIGSSKIKYHSRLYYSLLLLYQPKKGSHPTLNSHNLMYINKNKRKSMRN